MYGYELCRRCGCDSYRTESRSCWRCGFAPDRMISVGELLTLIVVLYVVGFAVWMAVR